MKFDSLCGEKIKLVDMEIQSHIILYVDSEAFMTWFSICKRHHCELSNNAVLVLGDITFW